MTRKVFGGLLAIALLVGFFVSAQAAFAAGPDRPPEGLPERPAEVVNLAGCRTCVQAAGENDPPPGNPWQGLRIEVWGCGFSIQPPVDPNFKVWGAQEGTWTYLFQVVLQNGERRDWDLRQLRDEGVWSEYKAYLPATIAIVTVDGRGNPYYRNDVVVPACEEAQASLEAAIDCAGVTFTGYTEVDATIEFWMRAIAAGGGIEQNGNLEVTAGQFSKFVAWRTELSWSFDPYFMLVEAALDGPYGVHAEARADAELICNVPGPANLVAAIDCAGIYISGNTEVAANIAYFAQAVTGMPADNVVLQGSFDVLAGSFEEFVPWPEELLSYEPYKMEAWVRLLGPYGVDAEVHDEDTLTCNWPGPAGLEAAIDCAGIYISGHSEVDATISYKAEADGVTLEGSFEVAAGAFSEFVAWPEKLLGFDPYFMVVDAELTGPYGVSAQAHGETELICNEPPVEELGRARIVGVVKTHMITATLEAVPPEVPIRVDPDFVYKVWVDEKEIQVPAEHAIARLMYLVRPLTAQELAMLRSTGLLDPELVRDCEPLQEVELKQGYGKYSWTATEEVAGIPWTIDLYGQREANQYIWRVQNVDGQVRYSTPFDVSPGGTGAGWVEFEVNPQNINLEFTAPKNFRVDRTPDGWAAGDPYTMHIERMVVRDERAGKFSGEPLIPGEHVASLHVRWGEGYGWASGDFTIIAKMEAHAVPGGIVRQLDEDGTYTVQAGDSLYWIASTFGMTVSAIARTNNIADPDHILVGQVLTIS